MTIVGGEIPLQHLRLHKAVRPSDLVMMSLYRFSVTNSPPMPAQVLEWFDTTCRDPVTMWWTWDKKSGLESSELAYWKPNSDNTEFMNHLENAWIWLLKKDVVSVTFWFGKNSWSSVAFELAFPSEPPLRLYR